MGDHRAIGVIDSGVGGLTVVKELQKLLPQEDIIYFGDNANVPYGNRSEEEIADLTKAMIDYLIEKDVKLIAVACNTISTIVDKYFSDYEIPIVSIIAPTANYVVKNKLNEVGVIATNFTIQTGAYDKLIKDKDISVEVTSEGSPNLATLVDSADFTDDEVRQLVSLHMKNILSKKDLKDIILGCTHYPIVVDKFQEFGPGINFINPAYEQVLYIDKLLDKMDGKIIDGNSSFTVYTSGKRDAYLKMVDLLALDKPDNIMELGLELQQ
ncbi:MAG: glutamate racemase [Tissierella sp.]|nr:glutamate racemase [Tissierella sp.]